MPNLATFLRCIELPEAMADSSSTSLKLKLIKIGTHVVRQTIRFETGSDVLLTVLGGTFVLAIL